MQKGKIKIFKEIESMIRQELQDSMQEYSENHKKDFDDVLESIQQKIRKCSALSEDEKYIQALSILHNEISQPKSPLPTILTGVAIILASLAISFALPHITTIATAGLIGTSIVGAIVMFSSIIQANSPRPTNNLASEIILGQKNSDQALDKTEDLMNFIQNNNGLLPKSEIEFNYDTKARAKDALKSNTLESSENSEEKAEQPKEQLKSILKKGGEQAITSNQEKKGVTFSEVTQVSDSVETPPLKP